ncbi:MAG: hypothetical protein ACYC5K_09735, partial [Saccharofermentanales bacterium]
MENIETARIQAPPVHHAEAHTGMTVSARMSLLNEPAREFTPVPLWFWNDRLDPDEIRRQILDFYTHNVYGFMIHPRMGIPRDIPYLSDAFMEYVAAAVDYAAELGMSVCLYDEGMYPSGSAHGQVVACNPDFEAQVLVRRPFDGEGPELQPYEKLIHIETAGHAASDKTGHAYIQTRSGGTIRGIHFGEDSSEPGAPAAADLLNPQATACFIRLTHDRYYSRLSRYFGTVITSFFTDEPSLTGRGDMDGKIPWTDGMLDLCLANGITAADLGELFGEDD